MKDSTVKRAIVATVDLGFRLIEGLMLPEGTYAVAVPQLADVFSFDRSQASRTLKRLLSKDSPFDQIASELNSKKVNILNTSDVTRAIYLLAKQGNPVADEFMLALVEEGLDRRFAKAFNQKVTEEEYNARIRQRMDRILARYEYTDFIRDRYIQLHGEKPSPEVYRELTVMVNEKLFGRPHFFCDRDNMSSEQQKAIETFETFVRVRSGNYPTEEPAMVIEKILSLF